MRVRAPSTFWFLVVKKVLLWSTMSNVILTYMRFHFRLFKDWNLACLYIYEIHGRKVSKIWSVEFNEVAVNIFLPVTLWFTFCVSYVFNSFTYKCIETWFWLRPITFRSLIVIKYENNVIKTIARCSFMKYNLLCYFLIQRCGLEILYVQVIPLYRNTVFSNLFKLKEL